MKAPLFSLCAILAILAGCGGSGNSSSANSSGATPPVVNASPGGIWMGIDPSSGLQILGVVDEAGEFDFVRSDGAQFIGTATTNGDAFTASTQGYAQFGSTFADGSTYGSGTVSGTVNPGNSIAGTLAFTTSLGYESSGPLSLTFNSIYDSGSSLSATAGNYIVSMPNGVLPPGDQTEAGITSDGTIFAQDAYTGCITNGTLSIINASYDVYRVSVTFGDCAGAFSVLNGATFAGLAVLDTTQSPKVLDVGASGEASGTTYAMAFYLQASF